MLPGRFRDATPVEDRPQRVPDPISPWKYSDLPWWKKLLWWMGKGAEMWDEGGGNNVAPEVPDFGYFRECGRTVWT